MNKVAKVDSCKVVSNVDQANFLELYKMRWQIECMFKNLESSGFDIEATHLAKHKRLKALFSVLRTAFVWVMKLADKMAQGIKTNKILIHGRCQISEFRLGFRELKVVLFFSNTRFIKTIFGFWHLLRIKSQQFFGFLEKMYFFELQGDIDSYCVM